MAEFIDLFITRFISGSPRLAFKIDPSVFAKENTTAVLSVIVLAYPVPSHYSWYRNISNRWEELVNTPSILMTHWSLQFLLIITRVTPEDYRDYKLTVENTVGDPLNFTFSLQPHGKHYMLQICSFA